jgi:hypothetical protein
MRLLTRTETQMSFLALILSTFVSFYRQSWLILVLIGTLCGCSSNLVRVPNTERATTLWNTKEHVCLEYATAASKLTQQHANIAFPVTGTSGVQLSYESAESLASIYTVSDVLQFGHAALYRLCEAAGNGNISDGEYAKLLSDTLASINQLLATQMSGASFRARDRVMAALERLSVSEIQLAEAQKGDSTERVDSAKRALADARLELDGLLRVYGFDREIAALLDRHADLDKKWDALDAAEAEVKAAKDKLAKADADLKKATNPQDKASKTLAQANATQELEQAQKSESAARKAWEAAVQMPPTKAPVLTPTQ